MKTEFLLKQIKRGARRYEKETGQVPHVYEILEHEDDSAFMTIWFSFEVVRDDYGYKAMPPHLMYSFAPIGKWPNRFKWDGLKKWKRKK